VSRLPEFVKTADLFICEGLYGDPAKHEKAASHGHMIYREAAEIARKARVKELWLTHFSPAVPNPHEFKHVAAEIFPNTHIGRDRMNTTLKYEDE
jgi:ribonuclease Z